MTFKDGDAMIGTAKLQLKRRDERHAGHGKLWQSAAIR